MPDDMGDNGAEVSDPVSENGDESETFINDEDNMAEQSTTDRFGTEMKKKWDPKDPARPRRKKARRACFACQRAHLTCGDERPCKRCIKRGLAEACQDGVRKKAKYLHDAPPEALRPVLGPNYNPNADSNVHRARQNGQRQSSAHSETTMTGTTPSSGFFSQGTYPVYASNSQTPVALPEGMSFNPQASPASPPFRSNGGGPGGGDRSGCGAAGRGSANSNAQMSNMLPGNSMDFNALFDPSNPALYNFDLEGLNFGSQYAGWEFGILNKMGLGAETPPRENSLSQTHMSDSSYAALFGSAGTPSYEGSNLLGSDYSGLDQPQNMNPQGSLQHGLPHAYAIAAGPTSLASPSTETTASPQTTANLDKSPKTGLAGGGMAKSKKPAKANQTILGKRQRDAASIYEGVKEPYPYTAGFHNMLSVLRNRLSLEKLSRIARALAEIRPSFIACTKDLTREDLVFMEKCFQRTLVEFDDFLQHCCAPTIVCRRSGEVAAVNREFTALTGWTKDVLLGKEPNQNVYIRSSPSASGQDREGKSRSGTSTPQMRSNALEPNGGRPQPVFLAELLDDDSVVQFYRDFSQLAFEDSRGKVQRSCQLLKYRPHGDASGMDVPAGATLASSSSSSSSTSAIRRDRRTGILSNRVTRIDGEHGISRIERNGKVNCTYCWTIKRDVFDIPMMIIINFLPRYYPNQEVQQLAV